MSFLVVVFIVGFILVFHVIVSIRYPHINVASRISTVAQVPTCHSERGFDYFLPKHFYKVVKQSL